VDVANIMAHSVALNVLNCMKIKRDKEAGLYDKYVGFGDDGEPAFKMVL
jgi:hypothetical protein